MNPSTDEPATDGVLFDALGHPRRRLVVSVLARHGGTAHVRTVGRDLVALERAVGPRTVSREETTRVAAVLASTHLPVLETGGILTYDESDRTVTAGERFDQVLAMLDPAAVSHRGWVGSYLTIALLLGAVLLARSLVPTVGSGAVLTAVTLAAAVAMLGIALRRASWTRRRRVSSGSTTPYRR